MPYEDRKRGVSHPCDLIVYSSALSFSTMIPSRTILFFLSLFRENNHGYSSEAITAPVTRYDFDARCESTGGNPVCRVIINGKSIVAQIDSFSKGISRELIESIKRFIFHSWIERNSYLIFMRVRALKSIIERNIMAHCSLASPLNVYVY